MSNHADKRLRAAGQTLAIFALMLPVLIGMAGLGADGANAYLNYRNAQSAADLASLAGARTIPLLPTLADYTAAENRAVAVAASNGYGTGVTAIAPYVDAGVIKPYHVEVLIDSTINTYLLPLLGRPTWDIDVRAVAGVEWANSSASLPTIYAGCGMDITPIDNNPGSCPGPEKAVDVSGANSSVIGSTISNCGILVGGSGNDFDGGTFYDPSPPISGCTFANPGGSTFDPPQSGSSTPTPWPVDFVYSDFTCTQVVNGDMDLKNYYLAPPALPKTIAPGVYCQTDPSKWIKLSDSDVTGLGVTLVSKGGIDISGSNVDLTGTLVTSTSGTTVKVQMWAGADWSPVIKIAGSGSTDADCLNFEGIIMTEEGQIEISGQYVCSDAGSLLGDRVKLNGSNLYIDSAGLSSDGVPYLNGLKLYE